MTATIKDDGDHSLPTEPIDSESNDLVLRIDPDLFFADQRPLTEDDPQPFPLEPATTNLAERPTISLTLPQNYQAPEPVVADLAADVESTHTESGDSVAEVIPGSEKSVIAEVPISRQSVDSASLDQTPSVLSTSKADELDQNNDQQEIQRALAPAISKTWPIASQLIDQLNNLEKILDQSEAFNQSNRDQSESADKEPVSIDEMRRWTSNVRNAIQALPHASRLGDDSVEPLLVELRGLHQQAAAKAEQLTSRPEQIAWLQAAFAVERRLAVWEPVYKINCGEEPAVQHVGDDLLSISSLIEQLSESLHETGDAKGWSRFLLVEPLQRAFTDGDDLDRRTVSQQLLRRLSAPNMHPSHQKWIAGEPVQQLVQAVRPWASGAIDYSSLLHQIEKAESNTIDLVSVDIATSMRALQHARHPQAKRLANNLDTYYRNANVRFSISNQFLSLVLPEIPPRTVPVRTTLLGSRVTGVSRVTSDLQLQLIPSPNTWELNLGTFGNVTTRSVGRRGPAAVSTSSVNPYSASARVSITPADIDLSNAAVSVGGRSVLRGIDTQYDGWPLIGALVRGFAETEYTNKSSLANRIGRNRIRSELSTEINRTLNDKVNLATTRFEQSILGPLTQLQLQPKVVDMNSTATRLVARYRMAGDWQLAAMTPRPRAMSGNLFSVQVHQSAINNALEQLVIQEQPTAIDDVLQGCFDVLGLSNAALPDDLPEDTYIQFAKHRPITVEIERGKVYITMRVIRLNSGKRIRLRNFIVRAEYSPHTDGLSANLVRNGHLSISGPGMSMRQRFPVRAIFNKVLSPNRPLPLTSPDRLAERVPEGSRVNQFELRDGWIGISIDRDRAIAKIAANPESQSESQTGR